jgi:ATP-dependent RNA helicase DDX54/DBP10
MARTGSGKTAAFVIPMIERLKTHSAKVGARALILSPSRELALQTLKVVKEFGRGTDLKSVLLVGGDSLEDQFGYMAANPDIIIATPGRFLHLKVEMSLDLSSIRYVVFDEADRLFEMGFAAQLTEILHALPSSRQTLLFSATLPKSLVEFARAGLEEPKLVRLDAESKVSPDLESAFFSLKSAEKEGALLEILRQVIKMPTGPPPNVAARVDAENKQGRKRKRGQDAPSGTDSPTEHSTIVFTATKHHVEYVAALLRLSGFAVSHAYGSLDQTARKIQVEEFRTGRSNILVVTDVAARGIDIPVLANVINYDFPPQPKVFVHRVGRTARAGKRGWSFSLITDADAPYLLDLQLFLGRKLVLGRSIGGDVSHAKDIVVGSLCRDKLANSIEWVGKLLGEDSDLSALRTVSIKAEKLYGRTRNAASIESVKRAKEMVASKNWVQINALFVDDASRAEIERDDMLARVSGFRPPETIFELRKKGVGIGADAAEVMRKRREKINPRMRADKGMQITEMTSEDVIRPDAENKDDDEPDNDSASEDEVEVVFSQTNVKQKCTKKGIDGFQDSEHFMSYKPATTNLAEDRAYGVHSGGNTAAQNTNFMQAARGAMLDLTNDESAKAFAEPSKARGMRWDKRSKKYVSRANDEDGSKGPKMIMSESGQRIAASFRSGRFDSWRKAHKISRLSRTGENERGNGSAAAAAAAASASASASAPPEFGRHFKHKQLKAPKEADRFRNDYHRQKKRIDEAKEKRVGRFAHSVGRDEVKGVDDIRKARALKEKRRAKNARPSRRKG